MEIQHEENGTEGKFSFREEGDQRACMTYRLNHNTMIIDHTVVDREVQGKNIGHQLVASAAQYARAHQYRIKPLCSFARTVFHETPELNDVLE